MLRIIAVSLAVFAAQPDKDAAAQRYPMPAGEPSYWVELEREAYIAGRQDERAATMAYLRDRAELYCKQAPGE